MTMEKMNGWHKMDGGNGAKEEQDEFPLGNLSFSVDMDEIVAIGAPAHFLQSVRESGEDLHYGENKRKIFKAEGVHLTRPRAQRKASSGGKWSPEEDKFLKEIVQEHGAKCWKKVASLLGTTRTDVQCLHRWNKVLKPGLHKGTWTKEEDGVVLEMVLKYGVGNVKWSCIAAELPGRIGKQCRERWFNHLDPSIKRGDWQGEEDLILYYAQRHFGNRWCEISKLLPGRTENAVKNRWNSCTMKKWMKDKGLEPAPAVPPQSDVLQALAALRKNLEAEGVVLQVDDLELLKQQEQQQQSSGGSKEKGARKRSLQQMEGEEEGAGREEEGEEDEEDSDVDGELDASEANEESASLGNEEEGFERGMKIPPQLRPIPLLIRGGEKELEENTTNLQSHDYTMARLLSHLKKSPVHRVAVPSGGVGVKGQGEMEREGEEDSSSLLQQALRRLHKISEEKGQLDHVPFECLRYFPFLDPNAQRDVVRQLVNKFQRTSVTPRNFILMRTPRLPQFNPSQTPHKYIRDIISEVNHGQPPSLEEVFPDCFEGDFEAGETPATDWPHSEAVALMPPPRSLAPLGDNAAVEAALAVAQLMLHCSSEDNLRISKSLTTDNLTALNSIIATVLRNQQGIEEGRGAEKKTKEEEHEQSISSHKPAANFR